jgi:L-rhamnose mutarotase
MKQYCLALDLKDDAALIAAYEEWHQNIWPEIVESIKEAGIEKMEIYRTGNRLFMIVLANDKFSFESKASMDAANEKVQEWEQLMWNYQQPIPGSKPGEKWVLMNKIFSV